MKVGRRLTAGGVCTESRCLAEQCSNGHQAGISLKLLKPLPMCPESSPTLFLAGVSHFQPTAQVPSVLSRVLWPSAELGTGTSYQEIEHNGSPWLFLLVP